jgi:dienelactone hydrolase
VSGCGSHQHTKVSVKPLESVQDRPISMSVVNLRPGERVLLTLESRDATGVRYQARASFRASRNGQVDLATASPLAGSSYSGVWRMGMLASMKATTGSPFSYYQWSDHPQRFKLTVSTGGRTVASQTFTRIFRTGHYTEVPTSVGVQGFDGTFYSPRGARRLPAVLAFGGSEGGADGTLEGERLAANGIPTLFIGYFHAPGLPNRLVNIPLEYFKRALLWLRDRPEVDPEKVSVLGVSYGGQASLLLGAHYSNLIHGVVALVTSSVVTCGITGADRADAQVGASQCLGSPWSLNGKPIPHTRLLNNQDPWDQPKAVIPVGDIRAPVLLACGGSDQRINSCAAGRAIVRRRTASGRGTTLFVYPRAGHAVGSPFIIYEPGALMSDLFVPWDERGREDLWPRLISFLKAH